MRPGKLEDYLGQEHILGIGKPLRETIVAQHLHSMIFWGPPGVGKTSLAQLIAETCDAQFLSLSAVMAGVKDIREAVSKAEALKPLGKKTILFVDEVHRFNKAQQDAFLPFVENGTFIFIGATTENPSFELNNALLSRAKIYVLKNLEPDDLLKLLDRALTDAQHGLGSQALEITEQCKLQLVSTADGDARRVLNTLEIAAEMAAAKNTRLIDQNILNDILTGTPRRFDKGGDYFYDQISALHKSVRGSSPDAALYWFARMLDGGCDALYVARRAVRMASEDIGNADPRALQLALNAWETQERLGSPEGELAIAQALVYMACAPKSNATYTAFKKAMQAVREGKTDEVPIHLRNAPTKLAKEMEHGADYRYAHDTPEAYIPGESYLPPELKTVSFYQPVPRGLESKIAEKLAYYRQLDRESEWQRYPGDKDKEQGV
ncbi:MAG TPA: replication-associated recombination protein A [Pseudomonadales bacterium]